MGFSLPLTFTLDWHLTNGAVAVILLNAKISLKYEGMARLKHHWPCSSPYKVFAIGAGTTVGFDLALGEMFCL